MTIEEMFDIIDKAELRMTEAAELFRMAHSTLYDWKNGETKPQNPVLFEYAVAVTEKIRKATQLGHLPLKDDIKGKERSGAIKAVMDAVH